MFSVRHAMLSSPALRGVAKIRLCLRGNVCCRELSAAAVSTKPPLWTIKDRRPNRPREARTKREEYLVARKAAFAAEQEKAEAIGKDWTVRSALILERLQIVVPEFTDWQVDMWELQAQQSFYDREYPEDAGIMDTKAQPQTIKELLEQCPVPLAPRRTPADETNDRTSLNRALDQRLVLIIRPKAGDPWRLPESTWKVGETIRQAAERTAERLLVKTATVSGQPEDVAQLYFVGNCPAGWFWRVAEEEQSNGNTDYGDKVFINRAQLIKGTPALVESEAAEHLWVTKDEIGEYLGETMGVYLKHML